MNGFQLKFMKRKSERGEPTENSVLVHILSSSPGDTSLIQETLSQTFECKRFHCRLLSERNFNLGKEIR